MRSMLVNVSMLCLLLVLVLSAVEAGKKSGGGGLKGSGGYKKGGKGLSTLKKAAVIGVAAYGGYQLGKLTSRFAGFGGHGGGWGFNDWNRWREIDGFLCRNDNDCNWIDRSLFCQDYELDFQPSALWFGGDVTRIVGECACPSGMVWDDRELQCQQMQFGAVSVGIIVVIVIAALIFMCCCLAAAVFIIRKFCR